jgi:hypothetical protein
VPKTLSEVKPTASVDLSPRALDGKPTLSEIVCRVIALSSDIDLQTRMLIVRVLGVQAEAAIAIFDTIGADHWREKALRAATKAQFPDAVPVLDVVLRMALAAQQERHKLAHWIWAKSPELPDALLLADPTHLRKRDIERAKVAAFLDDIEAKGDLDEIFKLYKIDRTKVLVYTKSDLLDASLALGETRQALFYFRFYVEPYVGEPLSAATSTAQSAFDRVMRNLDTRDGVLERLNELAAFREAMKGAKP